MQHVKISIIPRVFDPYVYIYFARYRYERLNLTDGFISADGYVTISPDSNLWETLNNGLRELSNKYACLAMNTASKRLVAKPDTLRNFACFYKMWY